MGKIQILIEEKIKEKLNPILIELTNESHKHSRGEAESHFKLVLVCSEFQKKTRLERHRELNALLKEVFDSGLHALSLHLFTPEEWKEKKKDPETPACQHHHIEKE